jgi:hypothetical protein
MQTGLFTRESLAARWNMTTKTLDQWRWNGRGPEYIKIGREIFYRDSAIERFEESKQRKSTSSPPSQFSTLPYHTPAYEKAKNCSPARKVKP